MSLKPSIALLVVSDRVSRGVYQDKCEEAIESYLESEGYSLAAAKITPDGVAPVKKALLELVDTSRYSLILTAGGTGCSPRDLTPEATREIIERELPGVGEAMRTVSLLVTPNAVTSRATAGLVGSTMIVNLPGSPKAAVECLKPVLKGVIHGSLQAKSGDSQDCGKPE